MLLALYACSTIQNSFCESNLGVHTIKELSHCVHLTLALSTRMIPLIARQDYPTLQVHPNPWNQHVLTRFLHLISPPLIQNSLTLSGLFSKAHIHTFEKHIYFMS